MDTLSTTLRAQALHLASRGWHVFPITPGAKKPPIIDRWETRATTDPDRIGLPTPSDSSSERGCSARKTPGPT